jgi:hypothetical protein
MGPWKTTSLENLFINSRSWHVVGVGLTGFTSPSPQNLKKHAIILGRVWRDYIISWGSPCLDRLDFCVVFTELKSFSNLIKKKLLLPWYAAAVSHPHSPSFLSSVQCDRTFKLKKSPKRCENIALVGAVVNKNFLPQKLFMERLEYFDKYLSK